jgi:histidinol-phosphate phosphatase family protein
VSRRCVFLDRDGVINVKPPEGQYVRRWEEFHFLPGVADWVRLLNALDFLVVVVTNQRGVARGLLRLEDLREVHRRMVEALAREGARVDDVLFCPHERDSCACRKPLPGLVHAAQQRWDIDLRASLLIGDSDCDRQLAAACGMRFLRAEKGQFRELVL